MALFVLCDPGYKKTLWCDEKLRGIQAVAARRREKLHVFTDITAFETAAMKQGEESSVIVLFDHVPYIQKIALILAKLQMHVILAGIPNNLRFLFSYSCVSPDMDSAARTIVDYLSSLGKKRIAQIAVSQNSWSETGRAEVLARFLPPEQYRVFYVDKSMEACYDAFWAAREEFDAVLCPTDHVAISLIEHLKARNAYDPSLSLITYGDTMLARLYDVGITTFSINYYACGEMAAKIHYDRVRYNWSGVNVFLKTELIIRDSTQNIAYTPSGHLPLPLDADQPVKPFRFELLTLNIGQLSRLLTVSDVADLRLMYALIAGYSYEKMSAFSFLSVEAVKYRLRKFRTALGCKDRSETMELIRKYVHPEKLLAMIEERERVSTEAFLP